MKLGRMRNTQSRNEPGQGQNEDFHKVVGVKNLERHRLRRIFGGGDVFEILKCLISFSRRKKRAIDSAAALAVKVVEM